VKWFYCLQLLRMRRILYYNMTLLKKIVVIYRLSLRSCL